MLRTSFGLTVNQNAASLVPKDRGACWSMAGRQAARSDEQNVNQGFILESNEEIFNNCRCLAKRHFGQQTHERMKPKCPKRALRSPASRYLKAAIKNDVFMLLLPLSNSY